MHTCAPTKSKAIIPLAHHWPWRPKHGDHAARVEGCVEAAALHGGSLAWRAPADA